MSNLSNNVLSVMFVMASAFSAFGQSIGEVSNAAVPSSTSVVNASPVFATSELSPSSCQLSDNFGSFSSGRSISSGIFGEAEWLNWRKESSNQSFAAHSDPVWLTDRDVLEPSISGSGARVKLGVRTESLWDLSVGYTFFKGDDDGMIDATVDPASVLRSTRSCLDLEAQNVSYSDETNIDILDFEIGRRVQIQSLNLRPFGGFRWAQINEDQNNGYQYLDPMGASYDNTVAHSSRLKAYGLRMGAEASVTLVGGLRAFGSGAGSVMVGDVRSKSYEEDAQMGVVMNRNISRSVAAPSLEAAAGLAWNFGGFEIKGGYEFNTFFNASNINNVQSDVLTHGFFAGGAWNF